jgi:hypothetical protein
VTPLAFSEAELARACAAAAWSGVERERAGRAAALAREEAAFVERLTVGLSQAEGAFRLALDDLATGLSKAFAAAVEAAGTLEPGRGERLEAMLRAALPETLHAPSIRIVAPPGMLETARRVTSSAMAAAAFSGRLDLSTDASLDARSIRIEWGDGWAEGDLGHVQRLLVDHLCADAAATSSATSSAREE